METNNLLKKAVHYQRNTFDNAYQAVVLFQDQAERVTNTWLDQVTGIPEEGKKLVGTWNENYRKGLKQYKDAVDEGFNRVEELLETVQ